MKGAGIIGVISGLIIGGVGGFFGARYLLKDKYEKDLEAQVKSCREAFANAKHMTKEDLEKNKADIKEAAGAFKKYSSDESVDPDKVLNTTLPKKPYIITVEDYGSKDGYDKAEFLYFIDGAIVNSKNRDIAYSPEQVTKICGNEWRDLIGPDDGEIYVRNDEIRTDIAITRDLRKYYNA